MARWSVPDTVAAAARRLDGRAYDLVHVLRLYLAPFAGPWLGDAAFVLDRDEDDALVRRRLGDDVEARKLDAFAAEWIPRADAVLAASALAGATLVPNPVPPGVHPPPDGPAVAPVEVVFVGNLSYRPNADGAMWLVRDVLPLAGPARTAIVGSSPGVDVLALAGPDVTVVADPVSVAPWYAAARVAVVPLHAGGGTRLKLLEALAAGVPVVTTSVGAEGIPVVDGEHVLVADDAPAFAAAVRRVLDDAVLRDRLVVNGRVLAEAYTWEHVVDHLTAVLRAVPLPSAP